MILSSRRQVGMALNPISMPDILAYLNLFGTTEDDDEKFVLLIVIMDSHYLSFQQSRKTAQQ
jgi:hypothetical protein